MALVNEKSGGSMLVFENSLLRSVPTLSSAQRGDRFMSVCALAQLS